MSSRPQLIAGIVLGVLAGVALFAAALVVVAIDGAAMSGQTMAILVLGVALGFVLDATWLSLVIDRLSNSRDGGHDEDGDEGWGRPGPDPERPWPPCEDLDYRPGVTKPESERVLTRA